MNTVISLILVGCVAIVVAEFLGPAIITMERFEKCGEDKFGYSLNIEIHRLNRTHYGITTMANVPFVLDDNILINISIAKWGDGGWKPHFMDFSEKLCSFNEKYAKDAVKELNNYANRNLTCPFEEGFYEIKDFLYDGTVSMPTVYGNYRIDITLIKDDDIITCQRVYLRSQPNKNVLPG